MNEGDNKKFDVDSSAHQPSQMIYGYPYLNNQNDEIDLGEFLANLLKQYKLIVGISVIGTLLAVAIALYLPNVYQKEVILSAPYQADVVSLNSNGYTTYTPKQIFKRYYDELRSPKQLENYIVEKGILKDLYPESDMSESTLIADLWGSFHTEIIEPQPEVKGGFVNNPSRIQVNLTGTQEEPLTRLLNGYVAFIESNLIENLSLQQKTQIDAEIRSIDRKIELSRSVELRARESEIARREEKNRQEIASIKNQIKALLAKNNTDKNHEIVAIDEAYKIAEKLKINKPTTIANMGQYPEALNSKTEINLTDRQELPLYLMGTKYLEAKREELNTRKSNTPFVDEYSELKQKIELLENDAQLAALKARKTDDPYIEELPELINRKALLESMSLDFSGLKLTRIEQVAKVTGIKIKPRRSLIVVAGCVLSGIAAIFIALIIVAVKGHRKID